MSQCIARESSRDDSQNYIQTIGSDITEYIPIFHYHKLLLNFLETSKFSCDVPTFELFCKMNPSYQFLSVNKTEDMSNLVSLHKGYLESFWKFNVYSRVIELIQTYTDRLFSVPKALIGTPAIQLQSMRLKKSLFIPRELLEKLESFVRMVDLERDTIRNIKGPNKLEGWHAEVFDNHVKDMRSFSNMCIDTDIMVNRKGDFLPVTDYIYMRIIKWLVERCDNSFSVYMRDTDQFFNMLYVFVYMHHLHYLCGTETEVQGTYDRRSPKRMWEDYEEAKAPYRAFQKSRKGFSAADTSSWFWGNNTMEHGRYRSIEEKMYYYGYLLPTHVLCTRPGLYPTMSKTRTANLDVVQFLAFQEYLFKPNFRNYCDDYSRRLI